MKNNDTHGDKKENIAIAILLILVLAVAAYNFYSLDHKLTVEEISRGGKGYVSDEVWYVSSARNILEKVFHVLPKFQGEPGASIIYVSPANMTAIYDGAKLYGIRIIDTDYSKINAFYVKAPKLTDIERYVSYLKNNGVKVMDIVYGWRIPDAANINNYMNFEHPPLVKYLIALSMVVFGDYPLFWRIPSIVAGLLVILFTYLVVNNLTRNKWLSLGVSAALLLDPILRAMASIAMLDVFVALATIIAVYFASSRQYKAAVITGVLGSIVKFSVLFVMIPIAILYVREAVKRDKRFSTLIYSAIEVLLISIILFISFQIIVSLPLIMYIGFSSWFQQSITGAISWHLSIKCVGPNCPVSSTPVDWFLGVNSFVLYYFTNNRALLAETLWPAWALSLVMIAILLPAYRRHRGFAMGMLFLLGILSGYILDYVLGGKTQYSFYAVQLVPYVYIVLGFSLFDIIISRERFKQILYDWYTVLKKIWSLILDIMVISHGHEE